MTVQRVILVVDDDDSVRRLVARALEQKYIVQEAADGLIALDMLRRGFQPDLIVCDVMMPRMDGITFGNTVKADDATKGIPFIFLTAKGAPMDVVAGINAGARHYLVKPVNLRELLEKVAKAIGG